VGRVASCGFSTSRFTGLAARIDYEFPPAFTVVPRLLAACPSLDEKRQQAIFGEGTNRDSARKPLSKAI
jgi:hypothetical protein